MRAARPLALDAAPRGERPPWYLRRRVGERESASTSEAVARPPAAASAGGPDDGARTPPDGELAARRAFDAMAAEHLPALRARAAQLCRAHADADDVVQDALLRAFRGRASLRDRAQARGWLLTIVTNAFIDLVRRQRARRERADIDLEAAPAPAPPEPPPAWHHVSVDDVRAAVALLPDDVRDTYRMFALEGKDYLTIAAAQGVPKATIGTRIHRARARLRAILGARLEPEERR
jgi:RNA polymerase sigma-70 factor (ECF subfamily)